MNENFTKKDIKIVSFYNSELDMICDGKLIIKSFKKMNTSDVSLMVVPIDDRLINRAHGVFDAMVVKNFKFFKVKIYFIFIY